MLIKNFMLRDFTADTMVLTGNTTVMWLPIDGHKSRFNSTGALSRSRGVRREQRPLYVAAVETYDDYCFTVVADGASTVRYMDEDGDEYETHKFLILALRYDPSDLTPPYPCASYGAMDPTGPLHWLKFWPERDLVYCAASDIARDDDRRLESLFRRYGGNEDFGAVEFD